jgi:outer membrane protein OmpA-like peptidoglycan-associated protein
VTRVTLSVLQRRLAGRHAFACAVVVLSFALAASARAQSPFRLDVQHLHPSALPDSGLATEGGPGLPAWAVSFGAAFHWGDTLLRASTSTGETQAILLANQGVLEPVVALGLPAGFALQFAWPLVLAASDTPEARDVTLAPLRGRGIGDPRLQISYRYEIKEDFRFLGALTGTIPTVNGTGEGAWAELGAEPVASLHGVVGLEGRVELVVLRANVGVRGRLGDASLGAQFRIGSELTWAAAIEVRPLRALHILAEVHGASAFDGFGTRDRTPLELLLGARVHALEDVELTPFVGVGLSEGYGTPAWRLGLAARVHLQQHDADGDGVEDADDRCPGADEDRDGFDDDDGCPDADDDGDGVPDADDRCPRVAGLGALAGCPDPDGDHDGVGAGDRCPTEAEDADHFEDDDGCPEPDNDRDGLADAADRCPSEAEDRDGFEDEDGCPEPDNDRDGILDARDRCPREAEDRDGFEDEDGCVEADNDGDGVADGEDGPPDPGGHFGVCRNLPETAGGRDAREPDGCPDSAVRVDVAARRIRVPPVFFDTDADVIQERSFADLQYVTEILAANAWIRRLVVEGHTDDRGSDEHNLDLSQRRAASVVRFLTERGVAADRLVPRGFGRGRPPTVVDEPACRDARSAACRQGARRVVFVIDEVAADAAAPPANS